MFDRPYIGGAISSQAPFIASPLDTQFYNIPDTQFQSRPLGFTRHRSVFERLTDPQYYTVSDDNINAIQLLFHQGSHRERFDELGNGRGLAGREYLYVHDGLTESPGRCHEVYSSVIKQRKQRTISTVAIKW